jgi:hypothetical protein
LGYNGQIKGSLAMKSALFSVVLLGAILGHIQFDPIGSGGVGEPVNLVIRPIAGAVAHRSAQDDQPSRGPDQSTKVRLRGRSTVAEALAAIGAQGQATFRGGELAAANVALEDREYGFWEAIDLVLAAGDLQLLPYAAHDGGFQVGPRTDPDATPPPPVYRGAFRLQPIRTEGARDLLQPAASQWRVIVGVWWEPRHRPIALQVPLAGVSAIAEPGHVGLSANPKDVVSESLATGEGAYAEVRIPLKVGSETLTSISQLEGELIAIIPGVSDSFEFPDLDEASAGIEQRGQSIRVRLEHVSGESTENEVGIHVAFDESHGALESHRLRWLEAIEIELNDGMGTVYRPRSRHSSSVSDNEISLRAVFPVKPNSLNLVVRAPARIHKITVPFSFRDLVLP